VAPFIRYVSDLVCERCGMEASYADADIADTHKTCRKFDVLPDGQKVSLNAAHDWREK
jgi:hypothetical protein